MTNKVTFYIDDGRVVESTFQEEPDFDELLGNEWLRIDGTNSSPTILIKTDRITLMEMD